MDIRFVNYFFARIFGKKKEAIRAGALAASFPSLFRVLSITGLSGLFLLYLLALSAADFPRPGRKYNQR